MTREEINRRAIDAAAAIDKGDSAVTVIKLRPHFTSIVRATLEEALAVCPECAHGVQISERDENGLWQHVDEHGECIASEIHDLIAKLDGEVPGE